MELFELELLATPTRSRSLNTFIALLASLLIKELKFDKCPSSSFGQWMVSDLRGLGFVGSHELFQLSDRVSFQAKCDRVAVVSLLM